MVAIAMALCNADRVVMSVAIVPMSAAHGWSQSFEGIARSSFLWGYLLSPIAGGALADRYGGKGVLAWGWRCGRWQRCSRRGRHGSRCPCCWWSGCSGAPMLTAPPFLLTRRSEQQCI